MFKFLKKIFSGNDNLLLKNLIKDGAFLVDVRSKSEFSEGNVKGSTNIPLDQIANQLAKFKGKDQIIVFCRSGMRSSQAKSILKQNGFTNVTNAGTWNAVNRIINL
jgi:phage shock protein E